MDRNNVFNILKNTDGMGSAQQTSSIMKARGERVLQQISDYLLEQDLTDLAIRTNTVWNYFHAHCCNFSVPQAVVV